MSSSHGHPRIRPKRGIAEALASVCKHTLLLLKQGKDEKTCMVWHVKAINRIVQFEIDGFDAQIVNEPERSK